MRLALSLAERPIVLGQHRLLLTFLSGRLLIVVIFSGRSLLQAEALEELLLLFLERAHLLLGCGLLLHLIGLSLLLDTL